MKNKAKNALYLHFTQIIPQNALIKINKFTIIKFKIIIALDLNGVNIVIHIKL